MSYKECELCSCKISKLKLYSYKKDLGIHTLQCPNCKASYILKGKITNLKTSEFISTIFGFLAFTIAFLLARVFAHTLAFMIFIFFLSFVVLSFVFSIVLNYLNLLLFSNLIMVSDLKQDKKHWLKKLKDYIFRF